MRKLILLLAPFFLFAGMVVAQEKTVKGKVVDGKDGAPISGATIQVLGYDYATVTANDGTFQLNVPPKATSLVISIVGYKSLEFPISGDLNNIRLTSGNVSMNEIVVVGFGTKIKKELTGNIQRIKGDEVKNIPVPNFTQALQGRASGVFVESENGKVGGGIKVRVRGSGSLSANNEPLYVVDGIPINTTSLSGNALADLNFNDVESFEVLKDASAAAIYGSRAANGVVLITTKKGRAGKTKLNVGLQYGINNPTNYRGFLNAGEYVKFFEDAAVNGAKYYWNRQNDYALSDGYVSEQEVVDDWSFQMARRLKRYSGHSDYTKLETNTDWEKLAFNDKSRSVLADVTASGGNEKTKYYVSGSYSDQDGILIGNTFQRISGRLNLDQEVSQLFKFGMNMSLARTKGRRAPFDNDFATPLQIVALAPITPVRDLEGNLYDRPTTTYYNPLIDYENAIWLSTSYRNLGNVYGQLNFTPNLSFRSELGMDILTQDDESYYGRQTLNGGATNGYGTSEWFRTVNLNTNNYFNYNNVFAEKHDFNAVLGMSYQEATTDYTSVTGEDFPVDALPKLASAGKITGGSSSQTNYSFLSYFARVNYKFNNRFLLALSGRVDGSSRFGEDSRYGFFPAASAGWILSNESFISSSKLISFLKIRASYGLTGNADGIGDFPQLGLWGSSKYNGSSGLIPTQLANPELEWEKSKQLDIGVDFGLMDNRISGEIDYYIRKTNDLLYSVPVPATSGFTSTFANVGSMENKGFEFVLNASIINGKDLKWTIGGNLSFNDNKITKLDGISDTLSGNDGRYLNSLLVGQSIGIFYGPKYAGVDPANGDALYYLQDGKATTNDYNSAGDFVVGNPNPDFFYGFNTNLTYKGIELNALFQGVSGNSIINGAGGFMSANGDWFDNQTRDQLTSWKNPGDVTMVPQTRWNWSGTIPNGLNASSRYVESGSYLRLKTITLAYNLSPALISRLKLSSARIFVAGQNLLTFTDYTGWDPEVNTDYRSSNRNQGGDFYAAPQIKTFSFGVNLGF